MFQQIWRFYEQIFENKKERSLCLDGPLKFHEEYIPPCRGKVLAKILISCPDEVVFLTCDFLELFRTEAQVCQDLASGCKIN